MWTDSEYSESENKKIEKIASNTSIFKEDDLLLDMSNSEELEEYRENPNLFRLCEHFGQRKLLLSEIYFLTKYNSFSDSVLYIGAAPGTHIIFLAELFPHKMFYLYDPRNFDKTLYTIKNVRVFRECFTDKKAMAIPNDNFLLISDIRSEMDESKIPLDMELQKNWIYIMRPLASLIKFRLPWSSDFVKYFNGKIFIQPYAPLNSTETRLIVESVPEEIDYNSDVYNNLLYEHNIIKREWGRYEFGKLDGMWDHVAEQYILQIFCDLFNKNIKDVARKINKTNPKRNIHKLYISDRKNIRDREYTKFMEHRRYVKGNRISPKNTKSF